MKNSAIDSYYWRHYIENNIGLKCPYFNSGTATFYQWHYIRGARGNKHQNMISGLVPFLFSIATLYCVRLANLVLDILC